MDGLIIPRTPSCRGYTFNGSIIALNKDGRFSTHFSSQESETVFVNLYRNGPDPGSPCNLSCKLLHPNGKLVFDIAHHVTENDFKEDPRFFIYREQLMVSYNKVVFSKDEPEVIEKVIVEACPLTPSLSMKAPIDIPINLEMAPWEKNWLFFEREDGLWVIYKLYPELIICNPQGDVVKRQKWHHPFAGNKWMRFMSRNLKTFKRFCKVTDLFWNPSESFFELRGGAHPVLLDGRYYIFAHTRELEGKLYRTICIVLNASTLEVTAMTNPLLIPGFENARIMYPVGAVFDTSKRVWHVSCGLNDVQQIIATIPHDWLKTHLIDLKKKK